MTECYTRIQMEVGQIYLHENGAQLLCTGYNAETETGYLVRMADGWTFKAHHIFRRESDGRIHWSWSDGGYWPAERDLFEDENDDFDFSFAE